MTYLHQIIEQTTHSIDKNITGSSTIKCITNNIIPIISSIIHNFISNNSISNT